MVGDTVRRGVPVTVRRAEARRWIEERPAPKETRAFVGNFSNYFYILILIFFPRLLVAPVLTPLPEVAMKIEQTEIVGLEAANRLCSGG